MENWARRDRRCDISPVATPSTANFEYCTDPELESRKFWRRDHTILIHPLGSRGIQYSY